MPDKVEPLIRMADGQEGHGMKRVMFIVAIAAIHCLVTSLAASPAWGQTGVPAPSTSAAAGSPSAGVTPPAATSLPSPTKETGGIPTTEAPAQAPRPVTATSATPCSGPPTILPQPSLECPEPGKRGVAIRVARVATEVVLGFGLGAALGIAGAYGGLNVDLLSGREAGVGLLLGTSLGVFLGVAPGVWLAGRAMGGDGSFGWTALAAALGTGAAAGILAIDDKPGTLAFAATIPIASAIIGYELSSHLRRARARDKARGTEVAARPPGISLLPTFGPSYVGIAGTF